MKRAAAAALVAFAASCAAPSAGDGAAAQFGAMREVMREGRVEPRVRLDALGLAPGSIGVGAVAQLEGEITIVDGIAHVTRAPEGRPERIADTAAVRATLLTFANPAWRAPRELAGELDESSLASIAAAAGTFASVDATGAALDLQLHVTRGACPHGTTTPATDPWRWSAPTGARVRLVGFFAPGRAGTLTHHGTDFHLHAVVAMQDGTTVTGHVDSFRLAPGAIVRVGACVAPR